MRIGVLVISVFLSQAVSGVVLAEQGLPVLPKVVGVISEGQSDSRNQVILEDALGKEQDVFSPGTKAFNRYTIKQVTRAFVVIGVEGGVFRLPITGGTAERLSGKDGDFSGDAASVAKQTPGREVKVLYLPGSKTPQEVRELVHSKLGTQTSEDLIVTNSYESFIQSDLLQKTIRDPGDLIGASVAYAPIQNLEGVVLGLRISDIQSAGLLSAFGFRKGDILVKVNLHSVSSYAGLRGALQDKTQGRILIEYLREGRQSSYAVQAY